MKPRLTQKSLQKRTLHNLSTISIRGLHTNGRLQKSTLGNTSTSEDALLKRVFNKQYPIVLKAKGNYIYLDDGRKIFDASGGAAVSCLGHSQPKLIKALTKQSKLAIYTSPASFINEASVLLCTKLVLSTDGLMHKCELVESGSTGIESGLRKTLSYQVNSGRPSRTQFISRKSSYHGITQGALSVSGNLARRLPYLSALQSSNGHLVSDCYEYRGRLLNESIPMYVARLKQELRAKIIEVGVDKVAGFIIETVVGASGGCLVPVPGYLKAMQEVCEEFYIILIKDEVMSGMGRTGLGAGHASIGAVMINKKVYDKLLIQGSMQGSQTFHGLANSSAVGVAVLNTFESLDLMDKVQRNGIYLKKALMSKLGSHPNVGNINGIGHFYGIDLVKNRLSKEPFSRDLKVSEGLVNLSLSKYNMQIYGGSGFVDGIRGDHIMIAPSFLCSKKDLNHIVDTLTRLINEYFKDK
ncbi:hypothetical protein HYALB_00008458 [Hymenoscyphus albidus]|uniref:Aminotransferase n=1 Tax=Hymenoscyphus albidus TaxID=595503 RepID=A0A9N9LQR4_9HELO|nr:hypothetical protein HYALB_00008458 [Hymenoscyphus albidus]